MCALTAPSQGRSDGSQVRRRLPKPMPSRLHVAALLFGLALAATVVVLLLPPPATALDTGGRSAPTTDERSSATTASLLQDHRDPGSPVQRLEVAAAKPEPDRPADQGDAPLTILTCDQAMRPLAEVPVALRAGEVDASQRVWRGTTATDGLARIPAPRALLQKFTGPVSAHVMLPLRPPVAAAIDRAALSAEPVRLVLPPTGQVVVWIEDLGPKEAEAVTVSLALPMDGPEGGSVTEASGHPRNGSITFPYVGLGLSLVVRAERPGQNEPARVTLNGPVTAGEAVHVRIRVLPPPDRVVLVMHLQDGKGEPFRSRRVEVMLEARSRGNVTSSTFSMTADGEGVLRIVTDENVRTMPERSLRLCHRKSGEPATEALVTIPATLVPGDNDLGIVAMLPPPLVCAGIVVDHTGKPVQEAELRVQARPVAAGGKSGELREVRGVRGSSDASGRFQLHGVTPPADLFLAATAPGFLPQDNVPFLLGSDGVRIALEAAAGLAGSVRLDDVVTAPDVVVELRSGGNSQVERLQVRGPIGVFQFDSLPPGGATVAVRLLGEAEGLLVADLLLKPGEITRDPRLQEVDLSKGRSVVHFTVVDPEGRPAKDARVAVLNGKDQTSFEGYMLSSGKGRVVTRVRPLEVLLFGDGYRSLRVPDLVDGATVTLPPLLRVRIRLPAACPLPAPPFALEARLDPQSTAWPANVSYRFFEGLGNETSGGGSPPWLQGVRARFGADGSALLPVAEPGTGALYWRLSRHQGEDRVDRWFANDPASITVRDEGGEQTITAGVGALQLDAARARLEAR